VDGPRGGGPGASPLQPASRLPRKRRGALMPPVGPQGVYKRALQGNASSDQAKQVGALAASMAEEGWRHAQTPRNIRV